MNCLFARRAAVVVAMSALLGACTTPQTQSFRTNNDAQVESSQIAIGADFSKFDRLSAEDMGIFYPPDSAPSLDDQQRIRQTFRQAFIAQLGGYDIVQGESGPTTLNVQASLIDYRGATMVNADQLRRGIRDMAMPGSLVFMMELKDSESGEVLARAADSAKIPGIATSDGQLTDWDAVEDAAQHWAVLFREFLDNNLNQ